MAGKRVKVKTNNIRRPASLGDNISRNTIESGVRVPAWIQDLQAHFFGGLPIPRLFFNLRWAVVLINGCPFFCFTVKKLLRMKTQADFSFIIKKGSTLDKGAKDTILLMKEIVENYELGLISPSWALNQMADAAVKGVLFEEYKRIPKVFKK